MPKTALDAATNMPAKQTRQDKMGGNGLNGEGKAYPQIGTFRVRLQQK